jgi:hypothetical protein
MRGHVVGATFEEFSNDVEALDEVEEEAREEVGEKERKKAYENVRNRKDGKTENWRASITLRTSNSSQTNKPNSVSIPLSKRNKGVKTETYQK